MTFNEFFSLLSQTQAVGNKIYALALYSQARLETGNFKDHKFTVGNNMFGMRPSQKRTKYWDTIYSGSNGDFACYASKAQSMIDRVDLDIYNGVIIPTDGLDFAEYQKAVLKAGYTPDSGYAQAWMSIFQQEFQKEIPSMTGQDAMILEQQASSLSTGKKVVSITVLIGFLVGAWFLWRKFKR